MPTKAELEAELAALKAELADRDDAAPEDADGVDVFAALKAGDLEALGNELAAEIEDSLTHKPLLTAAALLLLGYAVGRAR
ncbi:MAG: hypothetical protein HRU32_00710 [Rhodobacteraceae bacterium]|nr:hypothetical protein [Paracoccaceae bacterium]